MDYWIGFIAVPLLPLPAVTLNKIPLQRNQISLTHSSGPKKSKKNSNLPPRLYLYYYLLRKTAAWAYHLASGEPDTH